MPGRRENPPLPEEVAARLREQILTGRLHSGKHLHLERLAGELGTSVTPIREALLALRSEGFVDLRPRRGFTVRPLSREDLADICELQALLAGELAARAARRITHEQLAELEATLKRLRNAAEDHSCGAGEIDSRFLAAVFQCAGTTKLSWFLDITLRYTPPHLATPLGGPHRQGTESHLKILCALTTRDPDAARQAMSDHINQFGRSLLDYLEARKTGYTRTKSDEG